MATFYERTIDNIKVGLEAIKANNATTLPQVESVIDSMVAADVLATMPDITEEEFSDDALLKEQRKVQNPLEINKTSSFLSGFYGTALRDAIQRNTIDADLLHHGDPQRDFLLAEFWKQEPILSGAVYSMSAKMSTLGWTVIGKKRLVNHFADVYTNAVSMNKFGWGDFISGTAQDFYTTDRGSFWFTARQGTRLTGRLSELAVVDSLACAMTGNARKPVLYSSSVTGQDRYFRPGEYAHFASLPSAREDKFGIGFCAVSRAYRSARILMGLSNYDWEKLNNLPPEGLAAISGLTKDEFQDSLALWKAARQQNASLTYPQILWLLGSQPNTTVGIDFQGFSQIPEAFNRRDVVEQYVNVLALVFGVDAREFWPISSGALGSAAESEIQHMKAKGKGPGEFIAIIERWMNSEMPDGVEFSFDTQDVGEDQIAATIAKGWVDALMPLYFPGAGGGIGAGGTPNPGDGSAATGSEAPGGGNGPEPLITKTQFLRLLADRRVLPNWLMDDDSRSIRTDVGLSEKEFEDVPDDEEGIIAVWKDGKLKYSRPAVVEISASKQHNIPTARPIPKLKEHSSEDELAAMMVQVADGLIENELIRNIRGNPLPDGEALRGPKITKVNLVKEINRWMEHPILSKYVPNEAEPEEMAQLLGQIP